MLVENGDIKNSLPVPTSPFSFTELIEWKIEDLGSTYVNVSTIIDVYNYYCNEEQSFNEWRKLFGFAFYISKCFCWIRQN